MTDYQKVEINEPAPNEIEPEEDVQDNVQEEERPEWLPEKFQSPEDMAKAYGELESKLGADKEEATKEETLVENETEPTTEHNQAQTLITDASNEFAENEGKLSDETYEALAQAGLSRELVDGYARGQAALQENESTQIKSAANGEYEALSEWATKTLTDDEMNTFNETVNNGAVDQAKMVVSGLYARYKAEVGGTQPKLVTGNTTGSSTMPFESIQEVSRAMRDPRYKSGDKAYHNELERRLAVSTNI